MCWLQQVLPWEQDTGAYMTGAYIVCSEASSALDTVNKIIRGLAVRKASDK